jgi:hypothetical protein
MRKVHNLNNNLVYFGLNRGGGKILTIDNDVYGDDLYLNPAKIILTNANHENSQTKKHPDLLRF